MGGGSTVDSAVLLRQAEPRDLPGIIELLRLSLGEGAIPRSEEYWNWKHQLNPFGQSPVMLAEANDNKLVGLRAFMRWGWRIGGASVSAVRAVDTATHPDWQGKGIFTKLTTAAVEQITRDGVHFVFNTPNEKSRPGYLKMGWQQVGRVDLWIRPRNLSRLLRAFLRKDVSQEARADRAAPSVDFETAGEFIATNRLESLLTPRAVPSARKLETDRSTDYLDWRYARIPGFDYFASGEIDASGGCAIIFREKQQRGLREIRICELLVGAGGASVSRAAALLRRLHEKSGADYLSAMGAQGSSERSALIRAGFIPAFRLGPILTVRPLNPLPAGDDPLFRGLWRFSIGDLELF